MVFNDQRQEILLILWSDSDHDFYAVRLNKSGRTLSTHRIARGGQSAYTDLGNIALVFAKDHYFFAYDRNGKIYVKEINALGSSATKELEVGKDAVSGKESVGISYAPGADRFLVYWIGYSSSSRYQELYAQFLQ